MVACLSCAAEALPRRNPVERFRHREALIYLQNCTNFKHLKQIHAHIIRSGLSLDQLLVRKLLHLSSSYGKMDYATLVFHQIPSPHTFTWNLMIRAHTLNASPQQALLLFNLMLCRAFPPDKFTFPFLIKACTTCSAILQGKQLHALSIKTAFSRDLFVQNTLMDLYFNCGKFDCARKLFDKMRVRNVVSWTTMLTGLVACGDLDAARALFGQMPTRNVVSWTALINGYVANGQPQEAFEMFSRMQRDNVSPNEFTLVSLLKACTQLGSPKLGRWIHDYALKNGFKLEVFLGTALIDMYSKCGGLEDARQVFDGMQSRSLATWNSMITSLGVHGCGDKALALFEQMEKSNVQPDAITFVGVLCACVQVNNVDEGLRYLKYMKEEYGITPVEEHYTCMIELYRRADILDEVAELVGAMPNDNVVAAALPLPRASNVSGVAIMDQVFHHGAGELDCSGVSACHSSQHQLGRFKWDVG